jgi:hypothetical protein
MILHNEGKRVEGMKESNALFLEANLMQQSSYTGVISCLVFVAKNDQPLPMVAETLERRLPIHHRSPDYPQQ